MSKYWKYELSISMNFVKFLHTGTAFYLFFFFSSLFLFSICCLEAITGKKFMHFFSPSPSKTKSNQIVQWWVIVFLQRDRRLITRRRGADSDSWSNYVSELESRVIWAEWRKTKNGSSVWSASCKIENKWSSNWNRRCFENWSSKSIFHCAYDIWDNALWTYELRKRKPEANFYVKNKPFLLIHKCKCASQFQPQILSHKVFAF